jgi:hypothetical protein
LIILLSSSTYAFPYKGVDLKLRASITEVYNDNLTLSKEDKKEDFITGFRVHFDAVYEGKRRSLFLKSRINQQLRARYTDLQNSSQYITLDFTNDFSIYDSIRLTDNFSHYRLPAGFEQEFGRVSGRRETLNNSIALSYQRAFSERINMNTSYAFSQSFHPDSESGDSSSQRLNFNTGYRYGIASTLSLIGSYSRNNFGNSIYNFGLGLNQQLYITKKSYITGNVGLRGNSNNDISLDLNVAYRNQIDERNDMSLTFSTGQQFVDFGGDIFDNWQISANLKRELSSKLNSSISVNYGEGTYSSVDITDKLLGADLSLSYSFLEDLSGRVSYRYSNLDSTGENRGYFNNVISLDLAKTFF